MAGMTQMEAHADPLSAGTQAAAALVASEKTLYIAYAPPQPTFRHRVEAGLALSLTVMEA